MKFADIIRAAPSFGAAVRDIRVANGFCAADLAELLALDENDIRAIEQSRSRANPKFASQLANVLGLSEGDRSALEERQKRELPLATRAEVECQLCIEQKNDQMHQGHGIRHDDCVHAANCITKIARNFPTAKRAHCPPNCTRRRDLTREEKRNDAVMGKEGHDFPRWGTVEVKFRKEPRKARKAVRRRPRAA